jgi:hypothetical protein
MTEQPMDLTPAPKPAKPNSPEVIALEHEIHDLDKLAKLAGVVEQQKEVE